MPDVKITVRDKVATGDRSRIVCGNSDYAVRFDFDAEWDGYDAKTARFVLASQEGKYLDVVFTGDVCQVPVLQDTIGVYVGVYAGDLHTTTPAWFDCDRSILCGGGSPAAPPDDVYAQVMAILKDIEIIDRKTLDAAVASALAAEKKCEDAAVNPPVLSDAGTWKVWDFETGAYVDTGVSAKAPAESVLFTPQKLTQEQKKQVRGNIGAAPDVQPDWSQNDKTADDYIKNRNGCYIADETRYTKHVMLRLDEISDSGSVIFGLAFPADAIMFSDIASSRYGVSCITGIRVVFGNGSDGPSYARDKISITKKNGSFCTIKTLSGELSIEGYYAENAGYCDGWRVHISGMLKSNYWSEDLGVKLIVSTCYVPIDSLFLPRGTKDVIYKVFDMYRYINNIKANPDWDQQNEFAPGYIKNKPEPIEFWNEDSGLFCGVPANDLSFASAYSLAAYRMPYVCVNLSGPSSTNTSTSTVAGPTALDSLQFIMSVGLDDDYIYGRYIGTSEDGSMALKELKVAKSVFSENTSTGTST